MNATAPPRPSPDDVIEAATRKLTHNCLAAPGHMVRAPTDGCLAATSAAGSAGCRPGEPPRAASLTQ
ncbi:hypothetical protein ACWD5Q_11485 [Streptomyces sp. NPDC002513]